MTLQDLFNKRIDVDTHFLPRYDRKQLLSLLPRRASERAHDMLFREAERTADPRGVRATLRGEKARQVTRDGQVRADTGDPERDLDARLEAMKDLGFDMQVLIPNGLFTNMYGSGPYIQPAPLGVRLAICRLYNEATAEAQTKFPEAFIGTAIVPFDDLDASIAEVRRASEQGVKIVVLPFNWMGKNFDELDLYPFWETLDELGITVCVHGITQGCNGGQIGDHLPRYPAAFAERMRRLHIGTYMGFGLEYSVALAALSLGGVFDEFPNLRFLFFEAGASWMTYAMYACDRSFMIEPQCARTATMPSELIRAHCLTAIEPMESIKELVEMNGSLNYFFGTDFPHSEFRTFHGEGRTQTEHAPGAASIEEREGISAGDKTNILGANIARVLSR